ncbi:MAG: nucleotidyl transferase AbiEii/AbiGii toxin family protein [Chitinophagaceae bacterium]|nr:nucleotidyl transferase AbiEii/AbiGii toxin family protein [Chitinophagaceae bacterium]
MNLHNDVKLFGETIRAASHQTGINDEFVEKDYWITLVLQQLSKSKYAEQTVFKGGTSLSKGYGLINRFSEDVDIAIINDNNKSGNEIKTIIRTVEKEMTQQMKELQVEGVTSKGSRFRKSVFEYESENKSNKLIVEVNSFANPFPFQKMLIRSFVFDFFTATGNEKFIEQFNLQPFEINVLSKEQTLMEKLISLIRFSFSENTVESISQKIRHFYDLYFLMNDKECGAFVQSAKFKKQFNEILKHDREMFDEPEGWQKKSIVESPLINNFENIWKQVKGKYQSELSALAYTPIPDEGLIAKQFQILIDILK